MALLLRKPDLVIKFMRDARGSNLPHNSSIPVWCLILVLMSGALGTPVRTIGGSGVASALFEDSALNCADSGSFSVCTRGNAYLLVHLRAHASTPSRQWVVSSEANTSTSAFPNVSQIMATVLGCSFHYPWTFDRNSALQFMRPPI